MSNPQLELFLEFERLLPPKWFKQLRQSEGPLYPLIWGLCGALADLRASIEAVRQQAIPESSDGFWLSLHLLGLGIRRTTETDEQAHDRYRLEFEPTRNTRAGLRRYIEALSGLPEGAIAIETDFAARRYGSVRIVLTEATTSYRDVGWTWVARLLGEHIANGLQPAIDVELQDFSAAPLPPWQFDHPFPLGANQLGPLWARPAFADPLRLLEISRNQFAFLCAEQWELLTLDRIFRDTHASGQPGSRFAYLTEPCGSRCYEIDYQPVALDVEEIQYGARPFLVDGFRFDDVFPRDGDQTVTETVEIDIQIYGLSPEDSNLFPGKAAGFPIFLNPSRHTLPTASQWQILAIAEEFTHESIPQDWEQGAYLFGQSKRFPYNERFESGQETVTRRIPDYTAVSFWAEGGATVDLVETWRKRGNYWEINQYSEGDHSLPIASDWDLLAAPNVFEFHSFRETPPRVADFYGFEQFSFVAAADTPVFVEERSSAESVISYIPNVREDFTRKQIIEWLEVVATLEEQQTPDSLLQMGQGPWTLRLGSGNPGWGAPPPAGISPLQNEFAKLDPAGQWWTDAAKEARSTRPVIDVNGIAYLCLEFLLPRGEARLLREIELRIGYEQPKFEYYDGWSIPNASEWVIPAELSTGDFNNTGALNLLQPVLDIVHYRRLALTINDDVNWGIVFLIATRLRDVQTQELPAFRTGQSRTGQPLRDRDYIYVI